MAGKYDDPDSDLDESPDEEEEDVGVLAEELGSLNIQDQFKANRKTLQAKVWQRYNDNDGEHTPYQVRSLGTLITFNGHVVPNKPNRIKIDLANDVPAKPNKDLFAALQQHRRRPDWNNKELFVQQDIGGRVEKYFLQPSAGGQIFLQHVVNHKTNWCLAPKHLETVQRLDTFAESNGGNPKRQEMAKKMLEAIRLPQNGQPDFGEIFGATARQAAVQFILMTQIAEAVPPLGNQDGRTPGMDAYFRSALKQIVESEEEFTFKDIHDHGIVTGVGGTQVGRDMANPDISHDDLQLPDDVNGILRPDERGLFRNIVDDMSEDEQPQQPPQPQQQQPPPPPQ